MIVSISVVSGVNVDTTVVVVVVGIVSVAVDVGWMYWEQNALAVAGYEDIATITESEEIQALPIPTIHTAAKRIEKRIFQAKWLKIG